ncbi:hypothetical protein D3C87_1967090 [compost metagenome]
MFTGLTTFRLVRCRTEKFLMSPTVARLPIVSSSRSMVTSLPRPKPYMGPPYGCDALGTTTVWPPSR